MTSQNGCPMPAEAVLRGLQWEKRARGPQPAGALVHHPARRASGPARSVTRSPGRWPCLGRTTRSRAGQISDQKTRD